MKIEKIIVSSFLFAIIIFALFSGCTTSKERNIVGSWRIVPVTEVSDSVIWSFYDGDRMFIERHGNLDSGIYTVTTSIIEYYVDITEFCPEGDSIPYPTFHISDCDDGRYKLDLLSENFLKLQRLSNADGSSDAAFRYLEFEKVR